MKNVLRFIFRISKYSLLTAIFIILLQFSANSATLVLKNGSTVEGEIVVEDEKKVRIKSYSTRMIITYYKRQIEKIVYDKDEKEFREEKEAEVYFINDYQLRFRLLPVVGFAIGDLSSAVSIGYGANIDGNFIIPIKKTNFNIGVGLGVGFNMYGTDDGTMMILPIGLDANILYHTKLGFRPYFRLNFGMAMTMLGGSSFDPTMYAGLGVGYVNKLIPNWEFFFEAGYRMVFETVRGDFINISIGAAYRMKFPKSRKEEKKEDEVKIKR